MKTRLIIASILCCMIGYVGFTTYKKVMLSETEKFLRANVEALTSGETGGGITRVICRCHTDLNCYGGNAVSFRPPCSVETPGTLDYYPDCRSNDSVCKALQ